MNINIIHCRHCISVIVFIAIITTLFTKSPRQARRILRIRAQQDPPILGLLPGPARLKTSGSCSLPQSSNDEIQIHTDHSKFMNLFI